jgi:hypothetical protein
MQARFYDPMVGRFLSTDPVYFQDDNPFTFNRYSYANNNPYKYLDPDGREAESSDTKPMTLKDQLIAKQRRDSGMAAASANGNQGEAGQASQAQGTAPAQEKQPQSRFENQTDMSKFVDDHTKAGLGYYSNYVDESPIPKKGEEPSGAGTQTVIGIVDRNGNVIREGRFDSATGRLTGGGARLPEGPIPLSDWMESRGF